MVNLFKLRVKWIISLIRVFKISHSVDNSIVKPGFFTINEGLSRPDYVYPKIIWLYWDSKVEIPSVVLLCLERVKKFCPDFDVRFLNEVSVKEFIHVPELPLQLPAAIKADYIRLKLLAQYGGVWMDSSIFINESLEWVFEKINNHDAFVFYSDECTIDIKSPITENWLIISPINSGFVKSWFEEFSKCIFSDDPVGYYNDLKSDKSFMQNLSRPDYLLCYISAIKVLKENKFKLLYASSASSGHYFNYKHNFNGDFVAVELACKDENKIPRVKLIKLNSGSRIALQKKIDSGDVIKNSYIGNIINTLDN